MKKRGKIEKKNTDVKIDKEKSECKIARTEGRERK